MPSVRGDEPSPGLGERDPAAAAVEQRDAGLALERGELLGDGGRRVGERAAAAAIVPRAATSRRTRRRRTSSMRISTAYGSVKRS